MVRAREIAFDIVVCAAIVGSVIAATWFFKDALRDKVGPIHGVVQRHG